MVVPNFIGGIEDDERERTDDVVDDVLELLIGVQADALPKNLAVNRLDAIVGQTYIVSGEVLEDTH